MKVLHIIPSVAKVRGGPSQAVIEMVKALRSQGCNAEIATTNDNGVNLLEVPLFILSDQLTEFGNVPIRFFPRFSPAIAAVREFAYSSSFTTWLWQHITDYDLIHVHAIFSYTSTIAMAIARIKKVPYINRPLGQLCVWSLQQSQLRKKIYLNLIEKSNLHHSKFLHFTAEQEREEFEQLGLKIPNFVLPHGVHIYSEIPNARQNLHQILQIPDRVPIILFMSRIHPKKGLEYLIAALGKLKNQNHQEFALAIAGNGETEYIKQLKDLAIENNLSDRIHWLGFVEGETKYLYLQGADLFALTSYSENFGIAVIEALASATPVLITKGVAIAPMVREQNIGYVTELDVEAIAQAIQSILAQPQASQQIGDRAQQYISEHYSWANISRSLLEKYEKIKLQRNL